MTNLPLAASHLRPDADIEPSGNANLAAIASLKGASFVHFRNWKNLWIVYLVHDCSFEEHGTIYVNTYSMRFEQILIQFHLIYTPLN